MGVTVIRWAIALVAVLFMVGGIALIAQPYGFVSAIWSFGIGAVLLVAVSIERLRYRSESADRSSGPIGPGGGEPDAVAEPRFRPTAEVFLDPTSGRRMRVLHDPASGERRYVAED